MSSCAQCCISMSVERWLGENWFCTATSLSPRIPRAMSICSTEAFETPASTIVPSSRS